MTQQDQKDLAQAARYGLCGTCQWAELVRSSKQSLFVLCKNPHLPKYQGQPVLRCNYFEARDS
jgi:hypothetical protein